MTDTLETRIEGTVERLQLGLVGDRMRMLMRKLDRTAARVAALDAWVESEHPRGQPENKGEFVKKGQQVSAGPGGAKAEPVEAPPAQGRQQASGQPQASMGHPGGNYSKGAYIDQQGTLHAATVEDAVIGLYENAMARKANPSAPQRKIQLTQQREVATLLNKLADVASNMIINGGKDPETGEAMTFDLCDVTVQGTNLFCVESKGIPRIQMPQLTDELQARFVEAMKAKYGESDEEELAGYLRATQNELNGVKVAQIAKAIREKPPIRSMRLVVSADNYIVDGHHRWAATVGNDTIDGQMTQKMEISRVNTDIITLLNEAFAAGATRAAVGAGVIEKDTPGPKAQAPAQAPGRSPASAGQPTAAR